jgi:hypothetical protein
LRFFPKTNKLSLEKLPRSSKKSKRAKTKSTQKHGAFQTKQIIYDSHIFFTTDQGVKDIILSKVEGTGVRFGWNLTDTCYKRQNIILEYNDGRTHRKFISPAVNRFDLVGLSPLTRYNVSFTIEYDEGDISNPVYFEFRTSGEYMLNIRPKKSMFASGDPVDPKYIH